MHKTQVVVTVNVDSEEGKTAPAKKNRRFVTPEERRKFAPIRKDEIDPEGQKEALGKTYADLRPWRVGGVIVEVYLVPAPEELAHRLWNDIGADVQRKQREAGRFASLDYMMDECGFDKAGHQSAEDEVLSSISVNHKPFTEQLKKRNPVLAEVLNHRLDDKKTEPKEIAKTMNRKYDTVLHDLQKIREEWTKFKASHPDD